MNDGEAKDSDNPEIEILSIAESPKLEVNANLSETLVVLSITENINLIFQV
jgi:hypothetical protein